jgi:hypothetical protein
VSSHDGFVQASRIAREVIKQNGDNSFFETRGMISTGIRREFNETAKGFSRKYHMKLGIPTAEMATRVVKVYSSLC